MNGGGGQDSQSPFPPAQNSHRMAHRVGCLQLLSEMFDDGKSYEEQVKEAATRLKMPPSMKGLFANVGKQLEKPVVARKRLQAKLQAKKAAALKNG